MSAATETNAVTAPTTLEADKPSSKLAFEKTGDSSSDSSELESAPHHGIVDAKLVRKMDLRLLPILTILYLLSFLDRSNVGNAKIEGLTKDLGMTGDQYLSGLMLFFIGYVLFEVPCNIILKRTSPRAWLPTLTFAFAVVTTLQGVLQSRAGFYVIRFALGVSEAGLFPGVVYYLSMWYSRQERQFRVALFFCAATLSGAFGGVLAWGIAHMNGVGGLKGWRWIFILEGILTAVVSLIAYRFVYNYPDTAKFLTENERSYLQAKLAKDSDSSREEGFNWKNVMKAVKDPKCWLYGLAFHTMSLPLYTLSLFLPSIIKDLGFTAAQAQLLTVPPYACACLFTLTLATMSERFHRRAPFIIFSSSIAIVGYIILLSDPRAGPSYVGVFFSAAGIYGSTAIVLSWPANNVSGQTKRAVANAMQISIGNLGAVIGMQMYRTETSPRYFLGHGMAMGYLCMNIIVVSIVWFVLKKENEKRDAGERDERLVGVAEGEWLGDDDPRWRFQN